MWSALLELATKDARVPRVFVKAVIKEEPCEETSESQLPLPAAGAFPARGSCEEHERCLSSPSHEPPLGTRVLANTTPDPEKCVRAALYFEDNRLRQDYLLTRAVKV